MFPFVLDGLQKDHLARLEEPKKYSLFEIV